VLLTPFRPPQVTELISVRRTGKPARLAVLIAPPIVLAIPAAAFSLSTRAIVGNVLVPGCEQADNGYRWTVIARSPGCGPASRWEIQLRWAAGSEHGIEQIGEPVGFADDDARVLAQCGVQEFPLEQLRSAAQTA